MWALALLAVAQAPVSASLLLMWGCSAQEIDALATEPTVVVHNARYALANGRPASVDAASVDSAQHIVADFCLNRWEVPADVPSEATVYALRFVLNHVSNEVAGSLVADVRYAEACRVAGYKLADHDPEAAEAFLSMAVSICRPSHNLDHHLAWTHLRRAYFLSGRERAPEALEALEACLPWFREHGQATPLPALLILHGKVLRDVGRCEAALQSYEAAAAGPGVDLVDLTTRRIGALLDLNRHDDALGLVTSLPTVTQSPMAARQVAYALRRVARQLDRDGRLGVALDLITKASAVLRPARAVPTVAIELALTLFQQALLTGRHTGRQPPRHLAQEAHSLLVRDPEPGASPIFLLETLREGGRFEREFGTWSRAAALYQRAVELAGESERPSIVSEWLFSLGQLGVLYAGLGRLAQANAVWRRALDRDGSQEWLWRRLYLLNHRLHQHETAAAVLEEAGRGSPAASWVKRERFDASWRLGRMETALAQDADCIRRVRALLALGREAEAREVLEAETAGGDAEARAFLSALLLESGEVDRGRALAADLVEPRRSVLEGRRPPVDDLPPVMQARLRARILCLHPIYSAREIGPVRLIPMAIRTEGSAPEFWLQRARRLAEGVAEFHQTTFPTLPPLTVADPVDLGTGPVLDLFWSYRELNDGRLRHRLPKRLKGEVFLVVCAVPGAECSGVAPMGAAFVLSGEYTPRARSVAVHEFYHALLDLPHPDGLQDASDPQSVMGFGCYVPRPGTWLSQHQQALCSGVPGVSKRLLRGWRLERNGRLEEALEWYLEARARDPLHLYPLQRAMSIMVRLGRPQAALRLLEERPQPGPDARLLGDLAADLARLGYVAAASRLLARCPGAGKDGYAEAQIGRAWMRGRHHRRAVAHLQHALELEPSFYTLSDLGIAYQNAGRPRDSRRVFLLALRIKPDSSDLLCRLAYTEAELGRFDKARELLSKAARSGPKPRRSWLYEGLVDIMQGRWLAALEQLEKGARRQPKFQYQWYVLGYVRWSLGRLEGAREAMERATSFGFSPEAEAWVGWLAEGASERVVKLLGRMRERATSELMLRHLAALVWPARYAAGLRREVPHHPRLASGPASIPRPQ